MAGNLIARLRAGPLKITDYADVAKSADSLKVRVFQLREKGITIENIEIPNGNRRPKVAYRLLNGTCPCCEQELMP